MPSMVVKAKSIPLMTTMQKWKMVRATERTQGKRNLTDEYWQEVDWGKALTKLFWV